MSIYSGDELYDDDITSGPVQDERRNTGHFRAGPRPWHVHYTIPDSGLFKRPVKRQAHYATEAAARACIAELRETRPEWTVTALRHNDEYLPLDPGGAS